MAEFEIKDTPYGKKLYVYFRYDKKRVAAIKSLSWERTHRSYDPTEKAWSIDLNPFAIKLLETSTGIRVPDYIKKIASKVKIIKTGTEVIVEGGEDLHSLISERLSYLMPGYEFSEKYRNGYWDGKIRLFKRGKTAQGFFSIIYEILSEKYDVEVVETKYKEFEKQNYEFNFEELREYQKRAVDFALRKRRCILGLPTGSGKTIIALKIIKETGLPAIICVHTKELLYQWKRRVEEVLGVECGVVGDGNWEESEVTVSTLQTLLAAKKRDENFSRETGVVIFDECHKTSAAEKFYQVGLLIKAPYRIGLSATPWRSEKGEGIKIEGAISSDLFNIDVESLIEDGFLATPVFEEITWEGKVKAKGRRWGEVYEAEIVENCLRNEAIVKKVEELKESSKILIDVRYVRHGEILEEKIKDAVFLYGEHKSDYRQEILEKFERGEIRVLISTLLREGVDIPSLDTLILAGGGKSDVLLIQTIGRTLRPGKSGKARIIDIKDKGDFVGQHYRDRKRAILEYYGTFSQEGSTSSY